MTSNSDHRASRDQLAELVQLCRAGKLFAVQEWLAAGKPLDFPDQGGRDSALGPLETAIEYGFHSLVELLIQGGASLEVDVPGGLLNRAIRNGHVEIAKLLVEHGADPKLADMRVVFDTNAKEAIGYFIEHGGDVDNGNPLAYALCHESRPALAALKRYRKRHPSFQRQADAALRYHCKSGNLDWISRLLRAGADPFATGPDGFEGDLASHYGLSGFALAAYHGHFDVFSEERLHKYAKHPGMLQAAYHACKGNGFEIVGRLLADGMDPNDQEDGGCSLILSFLASLKWTAESYDRYLGRRPSGYDSVLTRDQMKAIHLFAKHGARWVPKSDQEFQHARRSLLGMTPDYAVDFVWIMAKYKACSQEAITSLLRTPAMTSHIGKYARRVHELCASLSP